MSGHRRHIRCNVQVLSCRQRCSRSGCTRQNKPARPRDKKRYTVHSPCTALDQLLRFLLACVCLVCKHVQRLLSLPRSAERRITPGSDYRVSRTLCECSLRCRWRCLRLACRCKSVVKQSHGGYFSLGITQVKPHSVASCDQATGLLFRQLMVTVLGHLHVAGRPALLAF